MTISIQPVTTFRGVANRLEIDDSWANTLGGTPRFNWRLQHVSGNTVESRDKGMSYMTPLQWSAWEAGSDDEDYIKSCVLANLGLVSV